MASPLVPAGGGRDWEASYQSGDTPWEKGRPHPALVRWLAGHSLGGRVLVPGSGSGNDVRAIAADSRAEVVGLDIAPTGIRAARSHPAVGSETYVLGDFLTGAAREMGPFDGIFEHTCFCAIDPGLRPAYVAAAAEALRSGGHLLAVFYRDPQDHGEGGPPFGCTMDEVDRLFSPWFEALGDEEGFETFEGREGREVLRLMRRK